jgi:hypothetical protein
MIEYFDSHNSPSGTELAGNRTVLGRRGRVAAGVVVNENDARGGLGDGGSENLSRVYERGVQGTPRNLQIPYYLVLGVEEEDVELLVRKVAHLQSHQGVDIRRAPDFRTVSPIFLDRPPSKVERRQDPGSLRGTHSGDGTQLRDRPVHDPAERRLASRRGEMVQQIARQIQGGPGRLRSRGGNPGLDQYGQELTRGKGTRGETGQALTRALVSGPFADLEHMWEW